MGGIFSRAKSVSDQDENGLENEQVFQELRSLAEIESRRISDAEEEDRTCEAISSVTTGLEHVRQCNKTFLEAVKGANVETEEAVIEVLNRYRGCNEKTLELVDSLTASTAKLQDANALYKEAAIAVQGDDPNQNRERLRMWIAKAKIVQEGASTRRDQNIEGIQLSREDWSSTKILNDMKDRLDGAIKDYEDLRAYIELARKKNKESSRDFWRKIEFQLTRGMGALVLVVLLCGAAALVIQVQIIPVLSLSIPVIIIELFWIWMMAKSPTGKCRTPKRLDETLAKLNDLDSKIDVDRESLVFTKYAVSRLKVAMTQVWNGFDILENPNIDPVRLSEIGKELRSKCEKMDQAFTKLKEQIGELDKQVVEAHRYIVRKYKYPSRGSTEWASSPCPKDVV